MIVVSTRAFTGTTGPPDAPGVGYRPAAFEPDLTDSAGPGRRCQSVAPLPPKLVSLQIPHPLFLLWILLSHACSRPIEKEGRMEDTS